MALAFKILGQTGDASSEVTLYSVPNGAETKLQVVVANRGSAATYRVAVIPGGGATANENYVAFDEPIPANTSYLSPVFQLSGLDAVKVTASTATVSFTASGAEQT